MIYFFNEYSKMEYAILTEKDEYAKEKNKDFNRG